MKRVAIGLLVAVLLITGFPSLYVRAELDTNLFDSQNYTLAFWQMEQVPCQEHDYQNGNCSERQEEYFDAESSGYRSCTESDYVNGNCYPGDTTYWESTLSASAVHGGIAALLLGGTHYVFDATVPEHIKPPAGGFVYKIYHLHDGTSASREEILFDENWHYTFSDTGVYEVDVYEGIAFELARTPTILTRLQDLFVPPAHAVIEEPAVLLTTLRFTIEELESNEGNPSVLFIPGVQASRLYDGESGERLWEPGGNDDIEALALDAAGVSVGNVHTHDVIDEIDVPIVQSNIYKGFMEHLDGLVDDGTIAEWEAFPYDWRQDVLDLVEDGTLYRNGTSGGEQKYLVDAVERLAEDSQNGKVTLIGHSNGGLVIKALMMKLEGEGKDDLIDSIIFIATPHLGTPKAIATVLHGYDQEKLGGLVVDDEVARDVIRNMPSAYGLLPSEEYFAASGEAPIFFDGQPVTQPFVDAYGFGVTNFSEFLDFMNGMEGRSTGDVPINEPITANGALMAAAVGMHEMLDSWTAPGHVAVYEIVGTGLATIRAIEYREFTERDCVPGTDPPVCQERKIIKPFAMLTNYGDETVVSLSGNGYLGEKTTLYFDLYALDEDEINLVTSVAHANITETDTVNDLVKGIITRVSLENTPYVLFSEPEINVEADVISIHSPATLLVVDEDGNLLGRDENGAIKEEIPNGQYFEFTGSKYAIVPEEIDYDVTIVGEKEGGYTLSLDTLKGDMQENLHTASNMPVRENMVARFSKEDGTLSTIMVDYDNDGVAESEFTVDGEDITPTEPTPKELLAEFRTELARMTISAPIKRNLTASSLLAEHFIDNGKSGLAKLTIVGMEAAIKWRVSRKEIKKSDGEILLTLLKRAREGL